MTHYPAGRPIRHRACRRPAHRHADAHVLKSKECTMVGWTVGDIVKFKHGNLPRKNNLGDLNLAQLARMIRADWSGKGKGVNFAAEPYLEAMSTLDTVQSAYGMDSGRSIVVYFLSNAGSWRGNVARAVKVELKKRLAA